MEILIFLVLECNTSSDALFLKVGMRLCWAKCNFHLLFASCFASVHAGRAHICFFAAVADLWLTFWWLKPLSLFHICYCQDPFSLFSWRTIDYLDLSTGCVCVFVFIQCICLQFVYRWDLCLFPLGKCYRITVLPFFPPILSLWPWWWWCVQGLAQRP